MSFLLKLVEASPLPPNLLILVVFVIPMVLYMIWLSFGDNDKKPVFSRVPHRKRAAPIPDSAIRRPWKRNLPENPDAVVVGSGASGLMTAVILTRMGKKVLVLEQHDRAGGALHTFEEHGWEWDTGLHYVGPMEEPAIARIISDCLTDGEVDWSDCCSDGGAYDIAHVGKHTVELRRGREAYVAAFEKAFPGSTATVNKYLDLCLETRAASLDLVIDKMLAGARGLRWLKLRALRLFKPSKFAKYNRPLQEVLDEITDNRELQSALVYCLGDYGEPPSKASFFIQAQLTLHYLGGSSYPVGGTSELVKRAVKVIEGGGGRVCVRADVAEIVVEGGRAVGVRITDGPVVRAPVVVSTVGVMNTFSQLLPQAVVAEHGYDALLARSKISTVSTHLSLFVGLEGSSEELDLPRHNVWDYPSSDHDANLNSALRGNPLDGLTMFFISFPSAKDPDYENRHPGKAVAEVLSVADYELFEPFEADRVKHRGNQYNSMKDKLTEIMLARLYLRYPKLKGKVKYTELGTPITTKHYLRSPRGASYGLTHDPERFADHTVRPETTIPGLYLSGQDTFCVGVVPSLMSGIFTAGAITGRDDLFGEIIAERARRKKKNAGAKKNA